MYIPASNQVGVFTVGGVTCVLGSGSTAGLTKAVTAFSVSGSQLVANNGTVVTDPGLLAAITTIKIGSASGTSAFYNGAIRELALWNSVLPSLTAKALTA